MFSKNEQKFVKSLKVKKYRTREKLFLVEGLKNVQELLKSDFKIDVLLGTQSFFDTYDDKIAVRCEIVKDGLLEQLGTFKSNSSCLAVAHFKSEDRIFESEGHQFVLDGIGDPGNLGTIIRTLDWFGYNQLICSNDCAEFYHPKVIASTMGSFTRVNVQYVDIQEYLSSSKKPVYAADMNGKDVFKTHIKSPAIILMGSESNGISEKSKTHVTDFLSIPRVGEAESLNVGVATGIIAGHLRIAK